MSIKHALVILLVIVLAIIAVFFGVYNKKQNDYLASLENTKINHVDIQKKIENKNKELRDVLATLDKSSASTTGSTTSASAESEGQARQNLLLILKKLKAVK